MQQVHSIVAELRSSAVDLARLSAQLVSGERASCAKTLDEQALACSLIAKSLELAVKTDDGGTTLRVMVSTADEDTLMSAALLMVMSVDLFTLHGSSELSQKVRGFSDRVEAVMWKLDRLGKELPAPAPDRLN